MSFKTLSLVLLFALPFAGACTDAPAVHDDLAGEDSGIQTLAAKADKPGTQNYYEIRRDTRKCVSPLCGGYWVSRPNVAKITCANGKAAAECYIAELDSSALGLTSDGDLTRLQDGLESGSALVRGSLATKKYKNFGKLGFFTTSEAWLAGTDSTPDGIFVKLQDNHIVCITAPCSSIDERKLNSTQASTISDLDYAPSDATDEERDVASLALFGGTDGIIVAGDRYYPSIGGKGRTVTQFWTRLRPTVETEKSCFVGGCSGQVCSDQEGIITTCQFLPHYACFQTATCERQAGGECGWTETPELDACLAGSI